MTDDEIKALDVAYSQSRIGGSGVPQYATITCPTCGSTYLLYKDADLTHMCDCLKSKLATLTPP